MASTVCTAGSDTGVSASAALRTRSIVSSVAALCRANSRHTIKAMAKIGKLIMLLSAIIMPTARRSDVPTLPLESTAAESTTGPIRCTIPKHLILLADR